MVGTSTYTCSRNDIHDCLRCPRIVAFKAQKLKVRNVTAPRGYEFSLTPYEKREVGETVTKIAFETMGAEKGEKRKIDEGEILNQLTKKFKPPGNRLVSPETLLLELLRQDLEGMSRIIGTLKEVYGSLHILGKGAIKNPFLPTLGEPDFVALPSKTKIPVIIEVKNTTKKAISDALQASFYNSLAEVSGSITLNQHYEDEKVKLAPSVLLEPETQTIIIYPRLGDFEICSEKTRMDYEIVEKIWEAKQLGLMGKLPYVEKTDHCKGCSYKKFCNITIYDEIETAKPLPLIFAKGAIETGYDYNLSFTNRYIHEKLKKTGILDKYEREIQKAYLELKMRSQPKTERIQEHLYKLAIEEIKNKETEWIAEKLNTTAAEVKEALQYPRVPNINRILEDMSAEIEPWEKILGAKQIKENATTIWALTLNINTLPKHSETLTKKAWKKWS
ncbi:MAG: hypothetical protein QXR19_18345 [Candidatus Jordarchaeaceae archaeon]